MTPTDGIGRVTTDLKGIRKAVHEAKKIIGRKGTGTAEDSAATAEKLEAALTRIAELDNTVKQVTGEIKKEAKAKAAAEKELAKVVKTARAAESERDDHKTQMTYLKRQVDALTALSRGYGLHHADHAERLDSIIADPGWLKSTTGLTPGQFKYHLDHVEAFIKSAPDMPLFRRDARHAGKPGNRCKLHIRHLVLLTTMRIYTAAREDAMEPWFGVDQSNISRYLDLGYRILGEMTATADFMTSLLKKCKTVNDIREIIPDLRILVDGTHIERVRPGDGTARKAAYSGKKKKFTFNVQVMTDHAGMPLNLSDVVDGSTHDYTLFKDYLAGEGAWLPELAVICKEHGEELVIVVDLGYQGIKTNYGHIFKIIQGIRRLRKDNPNYEPKYGGLTEEDRKLNKWVSGIRIFVEHGMAKIKRFRLMRGPFVGTAEELRRVLNVVTGLANTNHMWDHVKDAPGMMLAKLTGMIDAKLAAKTVWT